MNFTSPAPAYWQPGMEQADDCILSSDQCVIQGEAFFVRGLIELPVIGRDDVFSWGVWVSLSEKSFEQASEQWDTPGRETEPAYFGWLATDLSPYSPSTINLKTMVHTRPVGERPFIELEPTDHPLAFEQRMGITMERAQQIAEALLHSEA